MKTRIITAGIILLFLAPFVFLSHTVVFPIMLACVSVVAAFEILRTFDFHKKILPSIPAYLLSASLPPLAYYMCADFAGLKKFVIIACAMIFAVMIYLFALTVFRYGHYGFTRLSGMLVMLIYTVVSFSAMSVLRVLDTIGFAMLMYVFLIAWITDIFAYFTGYFLGNHKLCPEISPKKTIEGAVGGIVFSTLGSFLFVFIMSIIDKALVPNYLAVAICAPILSVISQLGDLFASAVKREYGIKDFGSLLPGHGGILDRFDSIMAVCMPLLALTLVFPIFGEGLLF
ncbi:MAG: phosphatidate cytidylyltransferase [Clostridia bacterium]|nr:phosphatidate cytidylyltransferase [Clostridia bacterium]